MILTQNVTNAVYSTITIGEDIKHYKLLGLFMADFSLKPNHIHL
jgi:hypothetical protein